MTKTMYAVFAQNFATLKEASSVRSPVVESFIYDDSVHSVVFDEEGDFAADSQYPTTSLSCPDYVCFSITGDLSSAQESVEYLHSSMLSIVANKKNQ